MNLSHPNTPLGVGPAVGGGDDQTRMQCAEMESAVESIGEGGEVVARAFFGKRMHGNSRSGWS